MKQIIPTVFIIVAFYGAVTAQHASGIVEEGVKIMHLGAENAFSINLVDTDPGLAEQVWKAYVRTNFQSGVKYDRQNKEVLAENAKVRLITGFPVNLISTTQQLGPDVKFTLWIDLQGAYLSSEHHQDQAKEVEYILHDFAVQVERVKIENRLEAEERELARLEREFYRLEKAQERYHREIEISDHRLDQMKKKIVRNNNEQEITAEDIARQIRVVERIRRQLLTVNQ